jgi:hypothetical protein
MKVGLFIPCYIDAFFPEVGIATLERIEACNMTVATDRLSLRGRERSTLMRPSLAGRPGLAAGF